MKYEELTQRKRAKASGSIDAPPDDLAGLVARLQGITATSFPAELGAITDDAADAIEALAAENARLAASEPQCATVKPMAWAKIETAPRGGEWFIARTERGTARVVHYADEYDRFPISHDGAIWETPPVEWIPLSRILSAVSLRPEAEVRAEAWAAALEAAALKMAKGGLYTVWDRSEAIRTLTPPSDISAAIDRIKAEEYARGLADGMLRGAPEAAITEMRK